MTEKQLMDMLQLLKFAESHCKQLSIEEIEDLQRTVNAELYVRRVKDFKNHIDKAMPDMPNSTLNSKQPLKQPLKSFTTLTGPFRLGINQWLFIMKPLYTTTSMIC